MNTFLAFLAKLITFKSISTDPMYKEELRKTAVWINKLFEENSFNSHIVPGYGNPIVLSTYTVDKSMPTCFIYGHYDVQPADIVDGWDSDPFVLRQDDTKLYARGVVDNKGQTLIHMVSIFELIKLKRLGMNVIFIIEGDEESGGADLERFVQDHKENVRADFALISDGEMKGTTPTIEAGLRGGFNMTLTIKTNEQDLHSGIHGGAAPSAAHELSRLLGKIHENERITISGFYDNVDPTSDTTHTLQPSIEVTSIFAGYHGEGYRNSIPGSATAKINVRLVKSQEPERLFKLFEQFIKKELSKHASYTLQFDHPHNAVKLDLSNKYVTKASKLLRHVYGQSPLYTYSGGAIPVVDTFTNSMKIPTLLVNLANEDCNMHAANENFDVDLIKKGLEFSKLFFAS